MQFSEFIEKRFGLKLYTYQKKFIDKVAESETNEKKDVVVKNKVLATGYGKRISHTFIEDSLI